MEIGKRIRGARLEAGMSQRQLCGELITRNMLSQIENGSAAPSLQTLQELARRLKKPVGYFLGEETGTDTSRSQVEQAWKAYRTGNPLEAARILDDRTNPRFSEFEDVPILKILVLLDLADQAIRENRIPYAKEMLRWILSQDRCIPELKTRALTLLGRLEGEKAAPICQQLPSIDEFLLLKARSALEQEQPDRAAAYLEAADKKDSPRWAILRGRAYASQGNFQDAARCFHLAEREYPRETAPYLEQCYRELEDFKQAYFYACRQK